MTIATVRVRVQPRETRYQTYEGPASFPRRAAEGWEERRWACALRGVGRCACGLANGRFEFRPSRAFLPPLIALCHWNPPLLEFSTTQECHGESAISSSGRRDGDGRRDGNLQLLLHAIDILPNGAGTVVRFVPGSRHALSRLGVLGGGLAVAAWVVTSAESATSAACRARGADTSLERGHPRRPGWRAAAPPKQAARLSMLRRRRAAVRARTGGVGSQ